MVYSLVYVLIIDYPGRCYFNSSEPIILRKGEKKRLSKQCLYVECEKDYTISAAGWDIYNDHVLIIQSARFCKIVTTIKLLK